MLFRHFGTDHEIEIFTPMTTKASLLPAVDLSHLIHRSTVLPHYLLSFLVLLPMKVLCQRHLLNHIQHAQQLKQSTDLIFSTIYCWLNLSRDRSNISMMCLNFENSSHPTTRAYRFRTYTSTSHDHIRTHAAINRQSEHVQALLQQLYYICQRISRRQLIVCQILCTLVSNYEHRARHNTSNTSPRVLRITRKHIGLVIEGKGIDQYRWLWQLCKRILGLLYVVVVGLWQMIEAR